MAISLPSFSYDPLTNLLSLETGKQAELLGAIADTKASANSDTFAQRLYKNFSFFSKDDLSKIVRFLISIYNLVEVNRQPEVVAKDVVDALKKRDRKAINNAPPEAFNNLERFLRVALTLEKSLGVSAKALRVSSRYERLFTNAEILSDIRPIFPNDSDVSEPMGAVVNHQLRLRMFTAAGPEETYVVMNYKDLLQLHTTVERAMSKHTTLAAMIENLKLEYFANEGEDETDGSI